MFLINLRSDEQRGEAPASADLNSIRPGSSRPILVGRDAQCDIMLDSEQMPAMVSRVHAELRVHEAQLSIQDKGSVNGTLCEPARVLAVHHVQIKGQSCHDSCSVIHIPCSPSDCI